MKYPDLYSRLVANTHEPESPDGCWLWKGNVDDDGYGRLTMRVCGKHKKVRAIRLMVQVMRGANEFDMDDDPLGPIFVVEKPALDPDEETVDHTCLNTACVNPSHLELVTRSQNSKLRHQRKRT